MKHVLLWRVLQRYRGARSGMTQEILNGGVLWKGKCHSLFVARSLPRLEIALRFLTKPNLS
jgi:hypothetical protein